MPRAQLRTVNGQLEKQCTKCGAWKPADSNSFSPFKQGKIGLHPWCRSCVSTNARERYERNRKTTRKYVRDLGITKFDRTPLPESIASVLDIYSSGIDDGAIFKAYSITNTLNGETYIGITERSLRLRWKQHLSDAVKGSGYLLHQVMHRDGIENFRFDYLACAVDRHGLHELEVLLVEQFQSVERGYNQTRGGAAGAGVGERVTIDGKVFISRNAMARNFGLDEATVAQRINKYGWTIEQAIGLQPAPKREPHRNETIVGGRAFPSFRAACRAHNVSEVTVRKRIGLGWSTEAAFGIAPSEKKQNPNNIVVSVDGQSFPSIARAASFFGLTGGAVRQRLAAGWSIEQAFGMELPPIQKSKNSPVTVRGVLFANLGDAAERYGLKISTVRDRLKRGKTLEQAFELAPVESKKTRSGDSIEIAGVVYDSHAKAARALKLDPRIVHKRVKIYGWSVNQAFGLEPPPERTPNHTREVTVEFVRYRSMKAACQHYGIDISTVQRRLTKGMSLDLAFSTPSQKSKRKPPRSK